MNTRSGYPGCLPADRARTDTRAKNRGGARTPSAIDRRTPHGRQPPACGQADQLSEADQAMQCTQPWPAAYEEQWEARAVDITRGSNQQKNRAWRRIKQESPGVAEAIARDLPALQAAFGPIGVEVDASYIEK